MKSRAATVLVILGTLLVFGAATQPWVRPLWRELRASEPAFRREDLAGGLGQGITIGLLGGFRALAADFLWLKTNDRWEQLDLPATQTLIQTVTALDPRPLYFWINGARIIADDMPVWRVEALQRVRPVSEIERRRVAEEQARTALALLDRALEFHPRHPLLLLEQGGIHFRRMGDVETAAQLYRLASEQPRAPYYAARIYAEFLTRLHRESEAYAWLCRLHPTLPREDPFAMADMVLGRIRELEETLGIAAENRYRPAA